jgi:hypothetical protein
MANIEQSYASPVRPTTSSSIIRTRNAGTIGCSRCVARCITVATLTHTNIHTRNQFDLFRHNNDDNNDDDDKVRAIFRLTKAAVGRFQIADQLD